MSVPEKFDSIGVLDYDKWLEPKHFQHTPQALRDDDVDIEVEACGICGSDIHAANGDWGRPYVPLAVGHEIVGKIAAVGPNVTKFKVGDRVGVGAQCDSCGKCLICHDGKENYCKSMIGTYQGFYKETNTPTQGGYSNFVRLNSRFTFKIPDAISSADAAPLLCGGITGFRPLMTADVKKGTKVGVNSIGGIGHMTILFAKAMGAEVTAISRNDKKQGLAKELGADHYISTSEEGFEEKHAYELDVIVNTGSSFSEGSVNSMLKLIRPGGKLISITGPPADEKLVIDPFTFLLSGVSIEGSAIGSPKDIEYMLEFIAEHKIKPWIETIDISEENVATAWQRMVDGDVKFRFVLTGYDKYFKK
ncbi:NADP-dependent alcohol dehydrogenase 6 [[Candida] railenensis]|uniref:NADP-dependent alcohol dehydrogenase 6 n=1 Tax=[Candida] railenensis TaxID=45579 RepID=A0A9P0QPY6_9ASCO|nr:NADP-dependent alcohol dehydrogenase 6 [[Candida] railenensis]